MYVTNDPTSATLALPYKWLLKYPRPPNLNKWLHYQRLHCQPLQTSGSNSNSTTTSTTVLTTSLVSFSTCAVMSSEAQPSWLSSTSLIRNQGDWVGGWGVDGLWDNKQETYSGTA